MNNILRFQVFSALLLGCALCVLNIEASQQQDNLDIAPINYVIPRNIIAQISEIDPFAKGRTALHVAAVNGQVPRVRELLKSELTNVNAQDHDGNTPFMGVVLSGSLEMVQELLKAKGIKVHHKNKVKQTALMWASIQGSTAIVKELLNVDGIDIDAQDNLLRTALHLAVEFGHAEVVELLVKVGADKTLKDNRGRIPAQCEFMKKLPKPIKDLLELKASE